MVEGEQNVRGGVFAAELEDLPSLIAALAWVVGAERSKVRLGALAHLREGVLELLKIGGGTATRGAMKVHRVEVEASTLGRELMLGNEAEVGGIDEEFLLSDPHREDLGDVVVGHGVAITVPGDEALDVGEGVDDACGVEGMSRERSEERSLLLEELKPGAFELLVGSGVADVDVPVAELSTHVVEIAKAAAVQEALLELPKATFNSRLVVGLSRAAGQRSKLMVGREAEEARVVDGL